MKKLLILFLLTGCTNYQLVKPGASSDTMARDKLYCDQYTMQSIIAKGGAGDGVRRAYEETFTFDRCMTTLGYYKQEVR